LIADEARAICRRMSINDGYLTKKERVWAELWWTEGRTTLGHGGEDHAAQNFGHPSRNWCDGLQNQTGLIRDSDLDQRLAE
jgi:hypothetical protein